MRPAVGTSAPQRLKNLSETNEENEEFVEVAL